MLASGLYAFLFLCLVVVTLPRLTLPFSFSAVMSDDGLTPY